MSICLVTYMHQRYIRDCLESMISQTYYNIELLILDDSSTDNTYNIIMTYEQRLHERFPHVSIEKNICNSGNVSANLNKLLRKAKGEFIKTFAGDDAMLPTYVEEIVAFLEKSENDDAILAYTNAYIVGDTFRLGDATCENCVYRWHKPYQQKELFEGLLKENFIIAGSVMMRRHVYEQYGLYDEKIPFEDYDLWLRLSRRERFVYLPSKLIYYRRAETSLTNYLSEDGKDKVRFMLMGGKKTIQKNLRGLSVEKRRFYQQNFFESYLKTVLRSGFWDMTFQMMVFMWRKGYCIHNEVYQEIAKTAKRFLRNKIKYKHILKKYHVKMMNRNIHSGTGI